MPMAVAASYPALRGIDISATRWLGAANRILLWGGVLLLILYPLLMVVTAAFSPPLLTDQALSKSDFFTERLLTAWINTFRLGLAVSLLSLLMGGLAALLATQSQGHRWIDLLMSVPFLTPPFLASLAWSLAVGRAGYLSRLGLPGQAFESALFSFWGMTLLMAAHYAPIVYFAVRAQIGKVPTSLLWAAQLSGAGSGRVLGRILLPIIFPAVMAGGFLAFASGIEEYGTPLVIGNRIGFPVISTEIGRLVSVYPINLTLASALASTLLALAGGVYFASHFLQRGAQASAKGGHHATPNLLSTPVRAALWSLVAAYALMAVIIPYGSMLLTSLLRLVSAGPVMSNLTWAHYAQAFTADSSALREALITSLTLAALAAAVATLLGAGCARARNILASLALIPVATPAITMAVGFIRAWNAPWSAWLPLYGSALLVGLFYTAQFLPYAVQYARAGLATIPSSYEWAARVHGASAGKTARRIIAPLLWPHCLGGAVLIFSISFRELVGSVLLRPPGMETVSTFILREFDQGSPATGMAMGMIAIASAFLCIALARRLSQKNF
jgi:iron(III) transport system permease protein